MGKKEYAIGERFECGLIGTIETVAGNDDCDGCIFHHLSTYDCSDGIVRVMVGQCCGNYREDGKEVMFKKVEQ
jgi:hypothetical protein